jgi:hypothetical protein
MPDQGDNGGGTGGRVAKYRQPGYQDRNEKPEKSRAPDKSSRRDNSFGPRPLQMPGTRSVSRCSQCGTILQPTGDTAEKCSKCGFELHSCKQCSYFDPSSRFECMQHVPERIPRKDVRNECTFYSGRVSVEKETSTPATARPMDARQAFENLFKK